MADETRSQPGQSPQGGADGVKKPAREAVPEAAESAPEAGTPSAVAADAPKKGARRKKAEPAAEAAPVKKPEAGRPASVEADAAKKPARASASDGGDAAPARPAAAKKKPAAAARPRPKPKPKAPPQPPKAPEDQAPPEGVEVPAMVAAVQNGVAGAVEQVSFWVGDWTIIVAADRLLDVMRFLKDDASALFDYCSDVTAADWPPREKRFDVIYCLYSTRLRRRLRVKVRVGEEDPVESVTGLWPAADWLEREVYDQFGINLVHHPDLRRILMPDQWQGHPQRKDYPLEGPGELLMESPQDWLRVRNLPDEAGTAADAEIE